jgi:tetratricopeptide (TPR) repeat protein
MQKHVCLVLVASLSLTGSLAFARGRPSADPATANRESREREARRACLDGDYSTGVAALSELFLDYKEPTYLFNQGRCYEQNERFEEAISRFREYLRLKPEERSLVEKHIAECEALQQKKLQSAPRPAAQPAVQPVTRSNDQALAAVGRPPGQPVPVVATGPQAKAPASPRSGLRLGGIASAGVGVAGLVVGVALNLHANSLAKSISPPNAYDRNIESRRKAYETIAWIGYGVGAAGLLTGAILYGIGWRKNSDSNVAVIPAVGPEMAGALLSGAF